MKDRKLNSKKIKNAAALFIKTKRNFVSHPHPILHQFKGGLIIFKTEKNS